MKKIYKCAVCGNVVELLHSGGGELVCCQQPMTELILKQQDEGNEKHLPVIEETEHGYRVKVGSVAHPMEQEHYIAWIELEVDGVAMRKFLAPNQEPVAEFVVAKGEKVAAREYCTLHGVWGS